MLGCVKLAIFDIVSRISFFNLQQITTLAPRPKQPPPSVSRPTGCAGECVSGLFALFCDDIDSDANCPGDSSCCVTNTVSEGPPPPSTTPRPTTPVNSQSNKKYIEPQLKLNLDK